MDGRVQGLRLVFAAGVALLLALNCADFYGHVSAFWSSPVLLIALAALCLGVNSGLLRGGYGSLANIFLALLFLLHLGYYLPVRLGLAGSLPYMPPVQDEPSTVAATVFCAAMLSLELGYLLAAMYCGRPCPRPVDELQEEWSRAALHSAGVITGASFLSMLVFVVQSGGPTGMLHLSYTDLFAFFRMADPRFAYSAMWYAPVGLLLWRVGMKGDAGAQSKTSRGLWWCSALLLLGPFLLVGARGPCFLFVIGCLYLRHVYVRRFSIVGICAPLLVLALLASLIASCRNLAFGERARGLQQWHLNVFAPLLEAGSAYRPYYGILGMIESGQQEYLYGRSYWMAFKDLVPNIAAVDTKGGPTGYYRTSVWFNDRLSPRDSAAGIGIGCSMIAEQYLNFGYVGVVFAFTALGGLLVIVESKAVAGSTLARAVTAMLVLPLCWYVRDDVFGCLRLFVWPVSLLILMRALRLPVVRSFHGTSAQPASVRR